MARKDVLNPGNHSTLAALLRVDNAVNMTTPVSGFNVRSVGKLARMGLVAVEGDLVRLTTAGRAAVEPEPVAVEPEPVALTVEQKRALANIVAEHAGLLSDFYGALSSQSPVSAQLRGVAWEDASAQFTAWLRYLPIRVWDSRLPEPGQRTAQIDRTQKTALAALLISHLADLADFWTDSELVSDRPEVLSEVSAGAVAWQLAVWLQYMPRGGWDARLPRP